MCCCHCLLLFSWIGVVTCFYWCVVVIVCCCLVGLVLLLVSIGVLLSLFVVV